ncbi:MAG: replication-associated recombination protein A [Gemmataceae bacterium]
MSKIRQPSGGLFAAAQQANLDRALPLAARMRPRTLDDFVGQEPFLGPGKLLRRLLAADRLGSLILHGPPGCGKTSLAHVIAEMTRCRFRPLNAVAAGIKELREILAEAQAELENGGARTILFVDEIHHFNRSQQDVLLPDVEAGRVILLGTTTHNPYFAINGPLLSRSTIFTFQPLDRAAIRILLGRALADTERGLGQIPVEMSDAALDFLAEISDGDARRALTALEVGVLSSKERPVRFTRQLAEESIQRKSFDHDATGDAHYDVISAFIKSLRGSDPDAAIYWLARLLEAGDDPRFIARRLVILASEDVGNADPHALVIATAAMQAVEFVGLPECQLNLAQAVTYLATASKSNASYLAINRARDDVRTGRTLPVPLHLRDARTPAAPPAGPRRGLQVQPRLSRRLGRSTYLPEERRFYEPTDRGHEATIRVRMARSAGAIGRATTRRARAHRCPDAVKRNVAAHETHARWQGLPTLPPAPQVSSAWRPSIRVAGQETGPQQTMTTDPASVNLLATDYCER